MTHNTAQSCTQTNNHNKWRAPSSKTQCKHIIASTSKSTSKTNDKKVPTMQSNTIRAKTKAQYRAARSGRQRHRHPGGERGQNHGERTKHDCGGGVGVGGGGCTE